jgi:hypothetical protein
MVFVSVAAALPRVTRQHQNRALAAARHARAVQLAGEGRTYQEIADELGYSNKGTVHRLVGKTLAKTRTEAVENLQLLEGERLDRLQAALWDQALAGDVNAGAAIVRIIYSRCRLFGLLGEVARPDVGSGTPRTVVVSPSE